VETKSRWTNRAPAMSRPVFTRRPPPVAYDIGYQAGIRGMSPVYDCDRMGRARVAWMDGYVAATRAALEPLFQRRIIVPSRNPA